MRVPFVDLSPQHERLEGRIEEAALRVLRSRRFVLGPEVDSFEEEFALAVGSRHCVGVDSGTSALRLALQAAGIGPGHEVVTTPFTFIATVEAIRQTGATPVLADVDPRTWNLDPQKAQEAITNRTRAILPVHLHGRAADLDAFEDICRRRGLLLIEDAAQAHLARQGSRLCGTVGLAGCFSFYPGKNLGAAGEAGAVATNDAELAHRVRLLRNFGSETKYENILPGGTNARLESIQAAILREKLPSLEEWTREREAIAERYLRKLSDLPVGLPGAVPEGDRHVWHVFSIVHPERDRLREALSERGIETSVHYPVPVHLQPASAYLGRQPGDFPVAEALSRTVLSLPLWVGMPESDQDLVVAALRDSLAES